MRLSDLIKPAVALFKPRRRRVAVDATRAYVEFRDVAVDELERFREFVTHEAGKLDHVNWVEVNPYTHRVVFAFAADSYTAEDLLAVVETAERALQLGSAAFTERAEDHPLDDEPGVRLFLELAVDLLGFGVGMGLTLSPIPAFATATNAAAILSVLKASPRLRRGLDSRLGAPRAELVLNLAHALAQGFAQRPLTTFVDMVHRGEALRETHARRNAWRSRERELTKVPTLHDLGDAQLEPRPRPLPRGPIEEYADRAWFVSLSGFALSFVTTRSIQRAVSALFGGLPKPARLGREVFASELGRVLAARRIVVSDPDALRRLDRIDCLVLQGDLVSKDKFVIGRVVAGRDVEESEARRRVAELFDRNSPVKLTSGSGWQLGPLRMLDSGLDGELDERAEALLWGGALVLGLARERKIVALVEVDVIAQTGVEELIAAAHAAEMRVVVSSNDLTALEGLHADDVIPEGPGLRGGIRRLQREGLAVCLVATGSSNGLPIADVGIGLMRAKEPVPWGAHIICRSDLSDVRFLLESAVTARRVAKQSVNLALGAASTGALVSAGGLLPMTMRRVMFVVNTATLISMANGLRNSFSLERRALPPPRDPTPWHALDARGVMARLKTTEKGLARRVAEKRAKTLATPRSAAIELAEAVTDELFNPLAPLLAAGAGLSAAVGSTADALMVGGVVGLNAVVGGVQRFRTERAIKSLAKTSRRHALVRRDGQARYVPADELVRGDIVLLHPGDVVPADCRLISTESLEVDASSLTGESMPVRKHAKASFDEQVADRSSMLYEGTSVAAGQAMAVVVATGVATQAQRGAQSKAKPTGGVEKRLRSLMALTGPVALGAGVGVVGAGLLRGRKFSDLVDTGVSLAVGAVPEGLPLLATAAQLAAAKRLAKRGALVRNVRSVEALGRVDVLCVDKTGTVTEGKISLSGASDGSEYQAVDQLSGARLKVLAAGLRATPDVETRSEKADPMDKALAASASKNVLRRNYSCEGWSRLSELGFEAARSYHAVLGKSERGTMLCVKGAPEVILPVCTSMAQDDDSVRLDDVAQERLARHAAELAEQGLRVLAVAERVADDADGLDLRRLVGLRFVGFLAFADPVRESAAGALEGLKRAGVKTLMITGDHPSTARAIANELELLEGRDVMTGAELADVSDERLDTLIHRVGIFARVTPSQKVRIVRALQRGGRVVAMVGDGANDAPAIRLADVGIALGARSTAAARGAADVVVTDERVETLVEAIVEGRAMWASVRDAVSILVGGNLGEIGFTLAGGLVDGRPPINARQLLLVNLLTDVAPAMAIALRPPSHQTLDDLAKEGPDASLGAPLTRDIAARAGATAVGAGTAWLIGRFTGSRERASTIGLAALVGTQLGQTLTSGNYTRPVVWTGIGSSAVLAAIIQTPGLSHFFGCRPLGPLGWATAVGSSLTATTISVKLPQVARAVGEGVRSKAQELLNRDLGQVDAPEPKPVLS